MMMMMRVVVQSTVIKSVPWFERDRARPTKFFLEDPLNERTLSESIQNGGGDIIND